MCPTQDEARGLHLLQNVEVREDHRSGLQTNPTMKRLKNLLGNELLPMGLGTHSLTATMFI